VFCRALDSPDIANICLLVQLRAAIRVMRWKEVSDFLQMFQKGNLAALAPAKADQHELLPRPLADQFWIYTKGMGEGEKISFLTSLRDCSRPGLRDPPCCLNPEIQPICHRKIAYTSRPTQTAIASAQIK
jgi:hypothetical protein